MLELTLKQKAALSCYDSIDVESNGVVLKNLHIRSLKHGGRHIIYDATVGENSAHVVLLKKGPRFSHVRGGMNGMHKTIGLALHCANQIITFFEVVKKEGILL